MKIDQELPKCDPAPQVPVHSWKPDKKKRIPHHQISVGPPPFDCWTQFLDEIIEENRPNATLTGETLIFARRAPTEANRQESASHHIM